MSEVVGEPPPIQKALGVETEFGCLAPQGGSLIASAFPVLAAIFGLRFV